MLNWNDIEEVKPNDIDLQMLDEIKNNPGCHEYVKESEINWD